MSRHLICACFVALVASTPAAGQHGGGSGARPSLTPAKEAAQFDFLLGQWELVVMPKVSGLAAKIHGAPRLLGTWKAWKAVDGFGVEDELRIVDGSGNPNALSHALRVYNPTDRKWLVTSIDAYRGRSSVSTGEWSNGVMAVSGQGTDPEGKPLLTRGRYSEIVADHFRFEQDRSSDGGRTWDEGVLRIDAKRVAAVAPR